MVSLLMPSGQRARIFERSPTPRVLPPPWPGTCPRRRTSCTAGWPLCVPPRGQACMTSAPSRWGPRTAFR
eukprot:3135390-Alexandrium_andersonii.AAC.1